MVVIMSQYSKYKNLYVTSLTPGEQLVLLLDHACVNIAKAIEFIKTDDIENAHISIVKAEDIFSYLIDNLDTNYPISNEILPIYTFIIEKLIEANIKKNHEILTELKPLVVSIRDTWKEADLLSRTGNKT